SSCSASWPLTRAWRNTVPPATTGELCPSPTGTRHSTFGSPFHGLTTSVAVPSRRGPSHCGQSSAGAHSGRAARIARGGGRGMGGSFRVSGVRQGQGDATVVGRRCCRRRRRRIIQEDVQRGVPPAQAELVGQLLQLADVLLAERLARLLIGRVAEIDAA